MSCKNYTYNIPNRKASSHYIALSNYSNLGVVWQLDYTRRYYDTLVREYGR